MHIMTEEFDGITEGSLFPRVPCHIGKNGNSENPKLYRGDFHSRKARRLQQRQKFVKIVFSHPA